MFSLFPIFAHGGIIRLIQSLLCVHITFCANLWCSIYSLHPVKFSYLYVYLPAWLPKFGTMHPVHMFLYTENRTRPNIFCFCLCFFFFLIFGSYHLSLYLSPHHVFTLLRTHSYIVLPSYHTNFAKLNLIKLNVPRKLTLQSYWRKHFTQWYHF